ncbi:uncharacterized protein SETTUDRAFT_39573 [Exserohilum turcica Et28A]|uniref:Uncharacterized protein n=1 Tax=Exserohilum turcicum (strain 28A) TaxID=671987 RepID=R0KE52_EXST2|nr:uncharacterized protein SETTUDRAFT_39573 [Exserohilum turcica Et28A]EOA86442.1 hypothetical protein SETTUDRAFT_39573 [Exserohilum turcica Et28A]
MSKFPPTTRSQTTKSDTSLLARDEDLPASGIMLSEYNLDGSTSLFQPEMDQKLPRPLQQAWRRFEVVSVTQDAWWLYAYSTALTGADGAAYAAALQKAINKSDLNETMIEVLQGNMIMNVISVIKRAGIRYSLQPETFTALIYLLPTCHILSLKFNQGWVSAEVLVRFNFV